MSTETTTGGNGIRIAIIGALVIAAFFGAYRMASAVSGSKSSGTKSATPGVVKAASNTKAAGTADAGTPACACCGTGQPTEGGITGEEVEGQATVAGDVQTIAVDVSSGVYAPNSIKLKAGVPAEITFGQSSGCTAIVQSKDLGFEEDLSAGSKTVKLGALEPGAYAFSCGMEMVFGKIVVE